MAKKLYVGNLSYQADEESLREAFEAFGEVMTVRIIKDEAGRSKGFGFVEMATDESAEKATNGLNGTSLQGRNIVVNEARPQADRARSGGPGRSGKSFGGGRSGSWR
ncbi:MAG: hypothetical protein OHK006_14900 [Thermodesulfovibrionales bacterium]